MLDTVLSALSAAQEVDRIAVVSSEPERIPAGVLALPSYEGSNDTAVLPAGAVAGRVGGIGINPRAAGLALDQVPTFP
mgnify:CR=1 FL=1